MQKVTPGKRCGLTFQRLKVCFSPSIPYSVRLFALLCCYSSCPFISYFSLSFFCCREAFCGHPSASRLPPYSHRRKSAEERDRYVYCLGLFGDFFFSNFEWSLESFGSCWARAEQFITGTGRSSRITLEKVQVCFSLFEPSPPLFLYNSSRHSPPSSSSVDRSSALRPSHSAGHSRGSCGGAGAVVAVSNARCCL